MKTVKFLFISVLMLSVIVSGCKKDDDPCDGISCQNGGNCVNGQCNCPQEWTGEFCQTPTGTNPCGGITCQNGGTCINGTCNCPSGWTGQFCQTSTTTDPCLGVTCLNGGTCSNGQCNCTQGYTGSNCNQQVTPSVIRVTKIEVTRFPQYDNGGGWDLGSGSEPDIFPKIFQGTTVIWDSPNYFEDAVTANLPYQFIPNPSIDLNPTTQYIIRLYDYDGVGNDQMGNGMSFTPYSSTNGFPTAFVIDAGGVEAFKFYVTYIF